MRPSTRRCTAPTWACSSRATWCCPRSAPTSASGRPSRTAIRSSCFWTRWIATPACPRRRACCPLTGRCSMACESAPASSTSITSSGCRRLLEACAGPVTAAQVLRVLFQRELDSHQMLFAMGEAIAHLNHLMHRGAVTRETGPDGVMRFAPASDAWSTRTPSLLGRRRAPPAHPLSPSGRGSGRGVIELATELAVTVCSAKQTRVRPQAAATPEHGGPPP